MPQAEAVDVAEAGTEVEPSAPAGSRVVQEPPRIPWSQLYLSFIKVWGYRDGHFDPEHLEILGPSGTGKTYFEATILQQRVRLRNSRVIFVATKPVDATIMKLGWPIVSDWKGVKKHRQVIFWPQTNKVGEEHEALMEIAIRQLLDRLWKAKVKVILVFDEIATSEDLGTPVKIRIKRFWREARSVGITIVAMKQRPQGVQRDMHSETAWIAAFKPKDEDDGARVAEVMGSRRQWLPILMGLDRDKREFVLLHSVTGQAVITWVDMPLKPAAPKPRGLYKGGS
jgi:DNA helicase HerA-like ATPase